MEFIKSIQDSVATSVDMKLFASLKIASYYHIWHSKLEIFSLSHCDELENFDLVRLSKNPYPKDNRPRGQKDLDSVSYHRRKIRKDGQTAPIWILKKNKKNILLDGAHRIVATYLENKQKIPCYIITPP